MDKRYIVIVTQYINGEHTVEIYPYKNKDNATERFHSEVESAKKQTCYKNKRNCYYDYQGGDLPTFNITYFDINTNIELQELNFID